MPRRIVIHAGFHKTGTSSVQQILKSNRAQLKPHMRSLLKGSMTDLTHAARGYSTWRDSLTLAKFSRRFHAVLSAGAAMPRRTLCLSAEELSGHLPGRDGLADYSAAPVLAAEMACVANQLYPSTEIIFVYSTRAPDSWLRSAYWEHVKSSSMKLDWADFAEAFGQAADLDRIVDLVASAQPHPVHRTRLEDSVNHPAGPATPVLDLCGVPHQVQKALNLPPPVNERRDDSVLLALLAANRDYPDRKTRTAAKQAILRAAQEDAR